MPSTDIKTFSLDPAYVKQFKIGLIAVGGLALMFLSLPWTGNWGPTKGVPYDPFALRIAAWIALAGFAWIFWRFYGVARQFPTHAVSTDTEGLWPAHLERAAALIRWEQIASVTPRVHLHRLDLADAGGQVLLRIEYQLRDFEQLRDMVLARMGGAAQQQALPPRLRVSASSHVFVALVVVFFLVLAWFAGQYAPPVYVLAPLVLAYVSYSYAKSLHGVDVGNAHLTLHTMLRSRRIERAAIERIVLGDAAESNGMACYTEVHLFLRDRPIPVRLAGLGVAALPLQQGLAHWLAQSGPYAASVPVAAGAVASAAAETGTE